MHSSLSRLLAVALRMHLQITVVWTINVSIDYGFYQIPNLNEEKNIFN